MPHARDGRRAARGYATAGVSCACTSSCTYLAGTREHPHVLVRHVMGCFVVCAVTEHVCDGWQRRVGGAQLMRSLAGSGRRCCVLDDSRKREDDHALASARVHK